MMPASSLINIRCGLDNVDDDDDDDDDDVDDGVVDNDESDSGDAPSNAASSRFNNRCGLVWGLRGLPGIANYCRSSELFCIFVFVFVFAFVFLYLRRLPGIANYRRSSELLEMYRNAYCPLNHIQRVIAYFEQKLRLFELSVRSCLMSKVV